MRRLVPDPADIALEDTYSGLVLPAPPAGADRSTVAIGMVASVDGAVTVESTSSGLGGDADAHAFRRLRDACDAIVVGAGTARAEDYGPPRASAARAAARRAAGLAAAPQLIVVTNQVGLEATSRLFTAERDPEVPVPLVVTSGAAPADRVEALADVAEVVRLGTDEVDLGALLGWCLARGWSRVLCEGGPALNGSLLAAGLVDEVFLTLAPILVGGHAGRIARGPAIAAQRLELMELHEHDAELLLRYRVRPGRPADGVDATRC